MKEYIKLFFISHIFILLTSANVYLVSKTSYVGIFISSLFVSFVYTFIIQKLSISNLNEKLIYTLGAATGCVLGVYLMTIII